jgi:predicted nucleic acid-binding protein
MRPVFADSCYWIALLNSADGLHQKSVDVSASLGEFGIVTSESVILEFLNHYSGFNDFWRLRAVSSYRDIVNDPNVIILQHKTDRMDEAIQLYENRPDKHYSLTDCMSMIEMNYQGITEILTDDHHFTQESFLALLKELAS